MPALLRAVVNPLACNGEEAAVPQAAVVAPNNQDARSSRGEGTTSNGYCSWGRSRVTSVGVQARLVAPLEGLGCALRSATCAQSTRGDDTFGRSNRRRACGHHRLIMVEALSITPRHALRCNK